MANDIGRFFTSGPSPDQHAAAESVANHLRRYWDPRMRRQIIAYAANDGSLLSPSAAAAIRTLPPPK